eukprot:5336768-Pleurochrysis_carterae.AAC.1
MSPLGLRLHSSGPFFQVSHTGPCPPGHSTRPLQSRMHAHASPFPPQSPYGIFVPLGSPSRSRPISGPLFSPPQYFYMSPYPWVYSWHSTPALLLSLAPKSFPAVPVTYPEVSLSHI